MPRIVLEKVAPIREEMFYLQVNDTEQRKTSTRVVTKVGQFWCSLRAVSDGHVELYPLGDGLAKEVEARVREGRARESQESGSDEGKSAQGTSEGRKRTHAA